MSDSDSKSMSESESEVLSQACESMSEDSSQNLTDSSSEDEMVQDTQFEPYTEEPLAPPGYDEDEEDQGSDDPDGLRPETLTDREEGVIAVENWCKCQHCSKDNLSGALEHRCCMEVLNFQGKLVFDGSIEHLNCIIQHEDYKAITNRAVLENVAPLLKGTNGRTYRRRAGVTQNEYLRAVAYRWAIRWLCGYMGWGNTRPLSACIYHDIRTRYPTRHLQPRGYRQN